MGFALSLRVPQRSREDLPLPSGPCPLQWVQFTDWEGPVLVWAQSWVCVMRQTLESGRVALQAPSGSSGAGPRPCPHSRVPSSALQANSYHPAGVAQVCDLDLDLVCILGL